jgi:sporulation protein YlmC with PRC-barrel domain
MRHAIIWIGASILTASGFANLVLAEAPNTVSAIQFVTEQPASEWRSRLFVGAAVQNAAGETVGDINDLIFDHSGRISTAVLGVGGFLGMGEKNVGVPFSALTFNTGQDGVRIINVALSKEQLQQAPVYKAIEKTALDTVKEKAIELGNSASEKAGQLKDQAVKKVEDMNKDEPKKQ